MLKYIIVLMMMLTTGCSLSTYSTPVEKLPLNLQDPAPLELDKVKFIVITESNFKEVFENMRKNKQTPALFGLSDEDYKKLATNIQKIKEYIIIEKSILEKYRNYYEGK